MLAFNSLSWINFGGCLLPFHLYLYIWNHTPDPESKKYVQFNFLLKATLTHFLPPFSSSCPFTSTQSKPEHSPSSTSHLLSPFYVNVFFCTLIYIHLILIFSYFIACTYYPAKVHARKNANFSPPFSILLFLVLSSYTRNKVIIILNFQFKFHLLNLLSFPLSLQRLFSFRILIAVCLSFFCFYFEMMKTGLLIETLKSNANFRRDSIDRTEKIWIIEWLAAYLWTMAMYNTYIIH